MGHTCFISFKKEDEDYKEFIQYHLDVDMIDKSLNKAINSDDLDYVMQKIRDDYLSSSTVTIHLIGTRSAENLGWEEQKYIKRELQASLYNGKDNTRNGILGVVLPDMYDNIYKGTYTCYTCGNSHDYISIDDTTVIKEFSYNYYLPDPSGKCSWREDDRYCVLVKWDDFCKEADKYINQAFHKRSESIVNKIKVYPK